MRAYLWYLQTERPQWEYLPLAVVPNLAARRLSSPTPSANPGSADALGITGVCRAGAEVGTQVPSSLPASLC